jgi:hypothetical protein
MHLRLQVNRTHSCPAAYSSFLEWNPSPDIAEAAERLYGHIDNLELYVGLQAEETKPVVDGAGLCPGAFVSPVITVVLTYSPRRIHDQSRYSQ